MAKKKKVKAYKELKEALEAALAYERGERVNVRVTHVPPRPNEMSSEEVRQIRGALNLSQLLFAHLLNVSPNAVRSWEQGSRRPQSAALKLLRLAKRNPKVLLHS